MKLIKIQIFPKGKDGWISEELFFGEHITQIYGPNGSGKTPIVQSISYCLGYPNVFRNDIYDRCNHAILHVEIEDKIYQFKRFYSKEEIHIHVIEPNGVTQTFYDEASHSAFIFELLGFSLKQLVTVQSKATPPYFSSLLPIFYLDQDEGYGKLYSPPSNFIKDQFSEMIRLAFRLPPKNSVDEKKARRALKDKLDRLDREHQDISRKLTIEKTKTIYITKQPEDLRREIQGFESELEQLKNVGNSYDDSINIYDKVISRHKKEIMFLDEQIEVITQRGNGLQKIISDINTEIETLSLNEGARRIFISFDEICGSSNCQLFSQSSNAYSKNLLYLKDQLKDLERNRITELSTLDMLITSKENLEWSIKTIVEERNESINKPELATLVDAISRIKNQVFELQAQLSELENIERIESILFDKVTVRNRVYDEYRGLSETKNKLPEIIKIRLKLKDLFVYWLDSIHTTNISKDITYTDEFVPVLGVETITQLKGSTRIRSVLAYHAALVELISEASKKSLRFMILDTPKQHDIENKDLDGYIKSLKALSKKNNIQIIFSTTEYHYSGDQHDMEWNPKFPGEDHLMFLKKNDHVDIKS
ncbi:AAA family ATPase [Aeromonas caviae]|uniref:AAA family ATPase n=1 Tax=Aeromonas sp. ASNIH3 TaxID=1636608 RepID=UPI000CD080C1|nr:AAA family ATPase [Aeromonas sp. ASNIH3]AUV13386.1 hypothetical protein C2U39_15240 [Aeromonas sp. ASNIH3]